LIRGNILDLYIAILAAGKGTRMKSDIPKVLHKICGKPLVNYVLDTVSGIRHESIQLIVGHMADLVRENTSQYQVDYVLQAEQLGTGHALMMLEPSLAEKNGNLIVLCGDVPFTSKETIENLLNYHQRLNAEATVLTVELSDAGSYGRIVRDGEGNLEKIVEAKDAPPEILEIKEINSGIYVFNIPLLFDVLKRINTKNAQKEYYLTDVIEILKKDKKRVSAFAINNEIEVSGINTIDDLQEMENYYESSLAGQLKE